MSGIAEASPAALYPQKKKIQYMACLKRVDNKCLWSRRPVLITDRYIHGPHEAPREDFKKQPRICEEKAVRIKEKRLPAPLYEAEKRKRNQKQLS